METLMTVSAAPSDRSEALVQLRTAYRLLNAYHRRILDLLAMTRDAVRDRFGELPKAWWASPQFWMPPKGNTDPTSRWPFDFICLQDTYFNWASSDDPSKGGFYFGIGHTADSALDKKLYGDQEPDPLAFPDVKESRTYLEVWAVSVAHSTQQSWPDLAAKHFADEQIDRIDQTWWTDRKSHKWEANGDALYLGGFTLDVADVWTKEQVTSNLVEPLISLIADVRAAIPSPTGQGRGRRT
jgi:hypothetical protein